MFVIRGPPWDLREVKKKTPSNRSKPIPVSSGIVVDDRNLTVYYANADNSLLSKMEELLCIVSESSVDIIAINEVKPKNGKIAAKETLNINGYQLFISDFDKEDNRGVCVYVKQHLATTQLFPSNINNFNDSVWVCIIKNTGDSNEILFGCIYRSGTRLTANKHDKGLHEQLLWASSDCSQSHKIIVGDFNRPNIKWTPEPTINSTTLTESSSIPSSEHLFVECIKDTFFHKHITEETRFLNSSS